MRTIAPSAPASPPALAALAALAAALVPLFLAAASPSLAAPAAAPAAPQPGEAVTAPAPREVTFTTADGITILGDLHEPARKDAPMILLFHQAGANARAEYGAIIPRLREEGYGILAIDQRSGGDRLGGTNRTVARLPAGTEYGYCAALPDLEAALRWVIDAGYTGPRFAWGSSYSAALAIRLGADHPRDLDGVLAFSPASGGPMADCNPNELIDRIQVPVLALRPGSEMEHDGIPEQFAAFRARGHRTYVASEGVHGSSMLNPERAKGGTEQTWKVVLDFLDTISTG